MSGKGDVLQRSGRCLHEGVSDPIDYGNDLLPCPHLLPPRHRGHKQRWSQVKLPGAQRKTKKATDRRRSVRTGCQQPSVSSRLRSLETGWGVGVSDHMTSWLASRSDMQLLRMHMDETEKTASKKLNGAPNGSAVCQLAGGKIIHFIGSLSSKFH